MSVHFFGVFLFQCICRKLNDLSRNNIYHILFHFIFTVNLYKHSNEICFLYRWRRMDIFIFATYMYIQFLSCLGKVGNWYIYFLNSTRSILFASTDYKAMVEDKPSLIQLAENACVHRTIKQSAIPKIVSIIITFSNRNLLVLIWCLLLQVYFKHLIYIFFRL